MKARSPVKTECAVCLKAKENVLLLAKIGKFICVGCIDNYHFLAHLNENQPVAPTLYVGRDGKPRRPPKFVLPSIPDETICDSPRATPSRHH